MVFAITLVVSVTPAFAVDDEPQDRILFDQSGIDAQVQTAVSNALNVYSENGQSAFNMITNAQDSNSDAPIPLVINYNTLEVIAHGAGSLYVGEMPFDVANMSSSQIRAHLNNDGMVWIEHMEINPENRQLQAKRTLLHLHDDGYIFAAGYFLADFEVQNLIENVVVQYETYGIVAFDMITPDAPIITDELYPFVIDFANWSRVADGVVPERVGQPEGILNTAVRSVADVRAELDDTGSAWVTYTFHNPATDITQLKLSWLYLYDGYVFGSGYYPLDTSTISLVDSALMLYTVHGNAAFDNIITPDVSDPLSADSTFVLDANTLQVLAHARTIEFVGTTFMQFENANKPSQVIIDELRVASEQGKGIWVWYMDRNPATQTDQLTRAYLVLYDGYIFGATVSLPDIRVQSVVDDALYTYRNDPQNSFDIVTSGSLNRDDLFPVIRNSTHLLAHGLVPSLIGPFDVHVARPGGGSFSDFDDGDTYWAQIAIFDATTGITQIKRTWYVHYDGYAFLSPYTVANAGVQSVTDYARFIYESNRENDAWKEIITPDAPIVTDDLYPFVINITSWTRLADGVVPGRVGQPETILDTSSRSVQDIRDDLARDGQVWLTYTFHNPATGVEQLKRTYLQQKDDLVFGSGYYILDSGVQAIVYANILDYNSDGRDATLASLNIIPDKPITSYTFVVDPQTGVTVAQGVNPELIGTFDWDAITMTLAVDDILDMTSNAPGVWVGYTHVNPITGVAETKRTWIVSHDGLLIGSGYYASEIPESDVKFAVSNAINIYNNNKDNDRWVDIITPDQPITTDALYPFVIDAATWTRLADGVVPGRVGQAETILDTSVRSPDDVLAELRQKGSLWITYIFHNPATGVEQLKRTYLELHDDGLVFGSGYYVLDSRVQSITHTKIQEYERDGRDAVINSINVIPDTPISTYAFVIDPTSDTTLAQNADPAIIGTMTDWNAITTILSKSSILDTLSRGTGVWFSYTHTSPITGEPELKHSWLVLHDGLIFGTGYYSHDIPATDVEFVVQNTIDIYESNENWVDVITPDQLITTDALYPFVIDAATWTRLADGVVPGRVGQAETILDTSVRSPDDVLAELRQKGSLWVTYIFHNPATGVEQLKRSFLQLHDGLVFGSGYYVLDSKVQSLAHSRVLEYERDGMASTISSINMIPNTPITTYSFLVQPRNDHTLAQNVNPALIAMNSDWNAIIDVHSKNTILAELNRGSGIWVNYMHTSPVTGATELKHTWLVLHDDLIFGTGHYQHDIHETDVKFVVRGAIDTYESYPNTWADIITPSRQLTTDALYPFVIDRDTWVRLADGVVPTRVNQPETILDTAAVSVDYVLSELDAKGSLWVTYIFHNPATDVEQLKRSFLQLHDGLVFGSGYYTLDTDAQAQTHSRVLEYERDGRDDAIESINMLADVPPTRYSFAVDTATNMTLAQGVNTALVNEITDWSAIMTAEQNVIDRLSRGSGIWVNYEHVSPTTGNTEMKRSWLVLHDGIVFGTGYYSSEIRVDVDSLVDPSSPPLSQQQQKICR